MDSLQVYTLAKLWGQSSFNLVNFGIHSHLSNARGGQARLSKVHKKVMNQIENTFRDWWVVGSNQGAQLLAF